MSEKRSQVPRLDGEGSSVWSRIGMIHKTDLSHLSEAEAQGPVLPKKKKNVAAPGEVRRDAGLGLRLTFELQV